MTFDARGVTAIEHLLETGYMAAVKDEVVVLTSPNGQSLITVPKEFFDANADFCSGGRAGLSKHA